MQLGQKFLEQELDKMLEKHSRMFEALKENSDERVKTKLKENFASFALYQGNIGQDGIPK